MGWPRCINIPAELFLIKGLDLLSHQQRRKSGRSRRSSLRLYADKGFEGRALLSQVGMQLQPSAPPFWSILLARYTDGEQLRGVRYVGCIDRVKAFAPISDLACGHSGLLADDDMETPRRWLPGQERRGVPRRMPMRALSA
jgi:hypothetical protein